MKWPNSLSGWQRRTRIPTRTNSAPAPRGNARMGIGVIHAWTLRFSALGQST